MSEPVSPPADLDGFLDRWRALHGGVDPRASLLVRRWLTVVHVVAVRLARAQVRPDLLTLAGLVLALATVPAALGGERWALLVAVLTAASALLDSLDGAVAVLTDRVTVWGALLDAGCDRCGDVALAVSLALLVHTAREPVVSDVVLVAIAAGSIVLPLLHEYVRARAASLRMAGLDVVTVGERPTRLIIVLMFALATGATTGPAWALLGLAAVAAVSVLGTVALMHRLAASRG